MLTSQKTAIHLLKELQQALSQMDDEMYSRPLDIFSGSFIGQHSRHIIEHYQCLLQQYQTGTVNYDLRNRDMAMELSTNSAVEAIEKIIRELDALQSDKPLTLELDYSTDTPHYTQINSSLSRELVANVEHTIHHMAIIKIGWRLLNSDIQLPEDFGVAPSTIRHRNNTCAQ